MAMERFDDDLNIIAGLGDDPKRDDGLSTQGFKSIFDKAGLLIQDFINKKLIPYIEKQNVGLPLGGGTMEGPINMNCHKLTGLNAPTADNEAANKGYVDNLKPDLTGYATEAYVDDAVKKAAPRNLLDNSDFTNPVNQRGVSSITQANQFIADRWQADGDDHILNIVLDEHGVTLDRAASERAGMYQQLERYSDMEGKRYTAALCVGGEWDCVSFDMGTAPEGKLFSKFGLYFFSVSYIHFLIRHTGDSPITIQKVALYEGEYTAETLPTYRPKGYGAELAECQRYFYKGRLYARKTADLPSYPATNFQYPVTMRIKPTLSFAKVLTYAGGVDTGLTASTHARNKADGVYTVVLSGTPSANDMTIDFEASADL